MAYVPEYIFPLILAAFVSVTYGVFVLIYTVQPTPFIDEIFHIPQAQRYCDGKFFEWDPKITTFPGLYLFSIGLLGPVSFFYGENICDVISLRLTNVVGIVFCFCTIYKLLNYLHCDRVDGWKIILAAMNMTIFPILYWFTFLYYTDVLATLLVLVMMLLHLHKSPNFAAVIGVISVLMRQTNIVWIGFLGGLLGIDSLGFYVLKGPMHSFDDLKKLKRRLFKIATNPSKVSECLANVSVDCLMYGSVLFSFVIFVLYNGGFVVGDRESHVPAFHLMQICYFCLFFVAFSLPLAFQHLRSFFLLFKKYPLILAGLALLVAALVQNNTIVHPFLLADNRHFTFYIWNRFFGKFDCFRYLVIPLYIFGAYVLLKTIQKNSFFFKLFYMLATCLCLVPQRLLEPRYFILPFMVARFQSISSSWKTLCLETLYFILINIITVYVFVSKTFYWPDFQEPQRIIW